LYYTILKFILLYYIYYTAASRRVKEVYCFTSVCLSFRPSQDIFRHIFLSNYWWQKSDIWSQALYRYVILWEAFLDLSDSYFLFADLVGFYTHCRIEHICTFFITFFSTVIDGRNLIFRHKLHIQCRYPISWEAFLDPSDSYFLFADFVDFYTHWTYMLIFRLIFSATIDSRNLIFRYKLHIGTPYRGKRFLTRQIPTSRLPT
jgi:hypothetical protein